MPTTKGVCKNANPKTFYIDFYLFSCVDFCESVVMHSFLLTINHLHQLKNEEIWEMEIGGGQWNSLIGFNDKQ